MPNTHQPPIGTPSVCQEASNAARLPHYKRSSGTTRSRKRKMRERRKRRGHGEPHKMNS